MAGPTRELATPPDDTDRYFLYVVNPVCRAIIAAHPELFSADIVAKARGEATTERRSERDESRAA